jgi:sterol desaturase/sphingolipid hydroxylase (fatty acid hydroxylase superfamily)
LIPCHNLSVAKNGAELTLRVPVYLQFYFWLLLISVFVFVLERLFARDPHQEVVRDGFGQDLFWLVFNTQYVSWMLALGAVHLVRWLNLGLFHAGVPAPETVRLIATWPLWLQFLGCFLVKDFLEWNIHRSLHRIPWLWEIHKLHHSSERLDWLATFRSHWGEVIIYKGLIYLPLVLLGVDDRVIFAVLVWSLLMQELVHANLDWDWGPLRYILNSPRLHAWHHAVEMHGKSGQNFGINLTLWDWLFGTVYWPAPARPPDRLGFADMEKYPRSVWARLWSPFTACHRRDSIAANAPVASSPAGTKKAAVARSQGS